MTESIHDMSKYLELQYNIKHLTPEQEKRFNGFCKRAKYIRYKPHEWLDGKLIIRNICYRKGAVAYDINTLADLWDWMVECGG